MEAPGKGNCRQLANIHVGFRTRGPIVNDHDKIVVMSEGVLLGGRRRCSECGGTGECPICFGTGTNVALNSDQEKCPHCHGTGICLTCGEATEITTLGLSD